MSESCVGRETPGRVRTPASTLTPECIPTFLQVRRARPDGSRGILIAGSKSVPLLERRPEGKLARVTGNQ